MNQPWSCPSPGCTYKGSESIHMLSVESHRPEGHMSSAELAKVRDERVEAERKELERDTVLCEAELPVDLFRGLSAADIFEKVLNLKHLLTYSERLVVQTDKGNVIVRSPASLVPDCPTARLRVRWPAFVVDQTPEGFWTLAAEGYEAILKADEVNLSFPSGIEVVMKDRRRRYTEQSVVPVPVPAPAQP